MYDYSGNQQVLTSEIMFCLKYKQKNMLSNSHTSARDKTSKSAMYRNKTSFNFKYNCFVEALDKYEYFAQVEYQVNVSNQGKIQTKTPVW